MGKTTKNATVVAVQQQLHQQAASNIKNVQQQPKPVSRPQTPIQQKAAPAPLAPKPVSAYSNNSAIKNKPSNPAPKAKGGNPLAPLTPGKAAAGLPDNVFGNMFDLPAKWTNSLKPAKPVARIAPKSAKPQQKQQQQKFTRKPRAPKNSTNEVFNISFLYPELKNFANQAPVAPKRLPGAKKQQQQQRPISAPAQNKAASRPTTPAPSAAPVQNKSRPTTPANKQQPQKPQQQQQQQQKSNSSPVNWQQNVWEDFYTSKHHTLNEKLNQKLKAASPAPKQAPNVNTVKRPTTAPGRSLKSTIPRPKEAKSPEIFSFLK